MTDKLRDDATDAQAADWYYEHRDELDADAEAVEARTPSRLSTVVSIRLSTEDAKTLTAAAEKAGMTLSAYMRQCSLNAASGRVVDLDRVRADVDDATRRLTDAREALR